MVHILTNSACDLTSQQAEELGITIISDFIAFSPTEQYRNNIEIDPPTLYHRLADCAELPKTAHPNLDQFMQAFRVAAAVPGCTELLYISLTSKMSGSCNTARSTVKLLEEQGFSTPVTVYDSQQVSYGLAVLVKEAARLAAQGLTAARIVDKLEELRPHVGVYFAMESLANARKGGRAGAIRVLAADLLKVKPILVFRDGLVSDIGIVRGFDRAVDRVVDLYREKAVYGGEVYLFHADREELAQQVAGRILAIDPAAKITIGWVGAVIGIYTGAGCLGLAFLQK